MSVCYCDGSCLITGHCGGSGTANNTWDHWTPLQYPKPMYPDPYIPVNVGWICPKCNAANAPDNKLCQVCHPTTTWTITTTC
jgi:hypothetical protein